jgi:hypothetical protein
VVRGIQIEIARRVIIGTLFVGGAANALDCTVPGERRLERHSCYINKYGNWVHVPSQVVPSPLPDRVRGPDQNGMRGTEGASVVPKDATARCKDGAFSFSQHRPGTCSGHGGVAQWMVARW